MVGKYYDGYKRSAFVSTMLGMFKKKEFNFIEFLSKLKSNPSKMQDRTSVDQYKMLIEDIYNYRRRSKVNLRY